MFYIVSNDIFTDTFVYGVKIDATMRYGDAGEGRYALRGGCGA